MRPAAFFTGIGGIAVVAGLLMAGEGRLSAVTDETAAAGQAVPEAAGGPAMGEAIPEGKAETVVPSAEPTGESAQADSRSEQQAEAPGTQTEGPEAGKGTELARPVVENAGLLSFGERRLQLAGIVPTPADRICGTDNERWPCGMLAKTALRLMLRNRTITCDLDDAEWTGTATADCRIGEQDIGTWLAETGWAEAAAGSPLAAIAEKAKQDRQGLHGDDPRQQPAVR